MCIQNSAEPLLPHPAGDVISNKNKAKQNPKCLKHLSCYWFFFFFLTVTLPWGPASACSPPACLQPWLLHSNGSQLGRQGSGFLPCREHVAVSGNICGCQAGKGKLRSSSVQRPEMSLNIPKDSPPQPRIIPSKMPVVLRPKNPGLQEAKS